MCINCSPCKNRDDPSLPQRQNLPPTAYASRAAAKNDKTARFQYEAI